MINNYLKTIILLTAILLLSCETKIEKGYHHLESGNYDVAIQLFNEALEKEPDNIEALKGKAKTLIEMSSQDESSTKFAEDAKKLFLQVVEINPDDFESWVELGNISYRLDNSSVFLADYGNYYYTRALEIDSTKANIWLSKGLALLLTNEINSALKSFDKALFLDPELANAWYHKGLSYNQMAINHQKLIASSKFAQSFNSLIANPGKSLNSFQNETNRHLNEMDNYLDQDIVNYYEQAIECFDKVIELNPGYKNAYIKKANCLNKLSRYNEALLCLQNIK